MQSTLTIYHGSNTPAIKKFDLDHITVHDFGYGIYFSLDPKEASKYGSQLYKAQLLLDAPFGDIPLTIQVGKKTINHQTVARIVQRLQKLDVDILSNYGDTDFEGYQSVFDRAVDLLTENQSDVDIIGDLINQSGDITHVLQAVVDVTGQTFAQKDDLILVIDPTKIKLLN